MPFQYGLGLRFLSDRLRGTVLDDDELYRASRWGHVQLEVDITEMAQQPWGIRVDITAPPGAVLFSEPILTLEGDAIAIVESISVAGAFAPILEMSVEVARFIPEMAIPQLAQIGYLQAPAGIVGRPIFTGRLALAPQDLLLLTANKEASEPVLYQVSILGRLYRTPGTPLSDQYRIPNPGS